MKKYALTLLFAFVLAAMHGQDRGLPERLKRSLDSMILDAMQIKAFPGAQLVIGDREGVLYARNYGYHDYSRKREVTDRDLYDVASCTKVVSTTFVVMRLYDRGLLRIDDPLVKYLPEFAGTTAESVTLGELLTHTSGMRAQTFYTPLVRNANGGRLFSGKLSAEYPYRIGKNYFVARDVAIDTLLLSRTPRAGWREATSKLYVNPAVDTLIMRQIIEDYKPERRGSYQYSDTNFWLLKLIAEKVSGESLDRLTHALLSELGCTLSGYNPLQTCDMEHCVPTEDDHILNRGTVQGYVHDELGALMGGVGGNAGLFSTAKEMARFLRNDAQRRMLCRPPDSFAGNNPTVHRFAARRTENLARTRIRQAGPGLESVGRHGQLRTHGLYRHDILDRRPRRPVHGFPVECRMPDTGRQQTAFDLSANQDMGGRKAGLSLRFVLIDHFSPDEFPDFFCRIAGSRLLRQRFATRVLRSPEALPSMFRSLSAGTHGSRNIPNPATGPADKQQPEAFLPYDTDQ